MPVYTSPFPTATLDNDIRQNDPNPFVERVLVDDSILINEDGRPTPLDEPDKLADGEAQNYARPYYRNLFSAYTTAGYTQMKQVTFTRLNRSISGYQYGVPTIK